MMKNWVWISAEDQAALVRARSWNDAYGMILSEILSSGKFMPRHPSIDNGGVPNDSIIQEAVELFDKNNHRLVEINEPEVFRRPLEVAQYAKLPVR